MFIGSGEEAGFKDGCLALRAATIAKFRANQSPGFSGQIPDGLGRQPLSTFRTEPAVGWGTYTEGLQSKGRPVETMTGRGTPGPQYSLDRVTYGQQVQSRFKTAPTPTFGSSNRPPLNDVDSVSPGPMTASVNLNALPPGPRYTLAGAPWRRPRTTEEKSPGPGEYAICGSLGQQTESTRESYKGFAFGGSGVARDMTLPSKEVPGPGHYAWHKTDRPVQPGIKFGSAPQRPELRQDIQPGPCQYAIPTTMGPTAESRFKTVVAPGFGTPFRIQQRPKSAAARLTQRTAGDGFSNEGPGPGHYDVRRVDDISVPRRPLSRYRSCPLVTIRPPSAKQCRVASANGGIKQQQQFDPESIRRAVRLTRRGARVPDVSFGVGPQRPAELLLQSPGPQAYDPENLRRAVVASRPVATRGVKFGTGPQRYDTVGAQKSPGPNAPYAVPSTLGPQVNSMFKSVIAPSFGGATTKRRVTKKDGHGGPGPCSYNPTMSNKPSTIRGITFGGAR